MSTIGTQSTCIADQNHSSSSSTQIPTSPLSPASPLYPTSPIKSQPLRIPRCYQRARITYAEPPPVPPSENQNNLRRAPNHVPIIITEQLKAAVQKASPHSPTDGEEAAWKVNSFVPCVYSRRVSITGGKARYIPIIIPDYAQPHNPFPPSPPLSSGEITPKELAQEKAFPERLPFSMRPAALPSGSRRPSNANSTASTSAESLHQPNSRSQISLAGADGQFEDGSQNELPLRPRPSEEQSTNINEPLPLSGSQQSITGTANLAGLMCNVHRCTGKEPHGLIGATTTIVGDKLYVFGGRRLSKRRSHLTNDLYELDLLRRHWTKLQTNGESPPPRYFHTVCAVGDSKLICYGGMSPAPKDSNAQLAEKENEHPAEVIVMSDVHVYDIATQTWESIKTKAGGPQGRYAHCATVLPSSSLWTSAQAPRSAIKHNASSSNPNEGALGYSVDGSGGAVMIVVGGQDSANSYIEQISVFNLRSMDWVSTQAFGRSCGAYRSVVAALTTMPSSQIGDTTEGKDDPKQAKSMYTGPSSMLIYSNYNFLDVKLELQVRQSDGSLIEKSLTKLNTPPGLRFPSGGVLDNHFLISGTFLTSTKQEYALWALNLKSLTWTRVDAGNSIFSQGSWNRGVLWPRRNTFVILGSRKRNLIDDYNHRRINFTNICLVELEAFGHYDNPRRVNASSSYASASAASIPQGVRSKIVGGSAGGKPHFSAAEELGLLAFSMKELADMEIECLGGERIPVNSHILSRRWGPYFVHAIRNGSVILTEGTEEGADTATLRAAGSSGASRNSSITITPSIQTAYTTATTLTSNTKATTESAAAFYPPTSINLLPSNRSRTLYLPHTPLTVHALLHFLYTTSLPPSNHALCTPQILCSLLQIARPYCIDGLSEAVVERLHQVNDGRNAPAVFNASAMAAGGGRGTAKMYGNIPVCDESVQETESVAASTNGFPRTKRNRSVAGSVSENSASDSSSDTSSVHSAEDTAERSTSRNRTTPDMEEEEEIWNGDRSCVIGLQKRGLRGLMEGRRLRERGKSIGVNQSHTDM